MEKDRSQLTKTIIISVILLIAVVVTIDLAYIYYQANFNQYALPSFCSVNELLVYFYIHL